MRPFKTMLKPTVKKKDKEPPTYLIKLFLILLVIAALNFALLFPMQISALFFQLEIMLLQFLNFYISLHRWEIALLIIISAIFGIYAIPAVHIPIGAKYGKSYLYYRTWTEYGLRWFRLLNGYYMAVNQQLTVKKGLRYTVIGNVEIETNGNIKAVQTRALEVDKEIIAIERNRLLMNYITKLEHQIKTSGLIVTKEEAIKLMKRGGENEETE